MQVIDDVEIDFDAYLKGPEEGAKVRPASDWLEATIEAFSKPKHLAGCFLPWSKTHSIVRLRRGEFSLWPGMNGHGKALELSTPIPTPSGWSTMGEMSVGDQVFDENGIACNVVACTDVMKDRPCYRIVFSDGTEIVADANHEWVVDSAQSRHSARNARDNNRLAPRDLMKSGTDQTSKRTFAKRMTTAEIAKAVRVVGGCWDGKLNYSIPVAGSIDTKHADLPIDPYVLGAWLGDGSSSGGQITTHYNDLEIIENIRDAGYETHEVKSSNKNTGLYRIRAGTRGVVGFGFTSELRRLGVKNNKHIPSEYLRASSLQRLSLLQGLMDTDGHVTNYGRCEFTSTCKALSDGVYELVTSLGMQAKIICGRAMLYGRDCGPKYRVTFTPSIIVFRLKRKAQYCNPSISVRIKSRFIVSCDPVDSVPVKCIQVDSASHQYLVSKAMIPTHNSMMANQVVLHLLDQGEKVCIVSMEMKPHETMQRMCRQAFCTNQPTVSCIKDLHKWTDGKLWLYDQQGQVSPDRVIAIGRYCHSIGITHLVVDNLLSCGIAEDDYNGQKAFALALATHAHDTRQAVHLLAHSRKGKDELAPPGKYDVRGSASLTDLCDNIFTVYRNKKKEKEIEEQRGDAAEYDALLIVDKHRHGDWEGRIPLWFDRMSQTYTDHYGAMPEAMKIIPDDQEVDF